MRVDVLRVLVPGLGLFVIVALFRREGWPAWTILFNTIVVEFIFGVVLAKILCGDGRCQRLLRWFSLLPDLP